MDHDEDNFCQRLAAVDIQFCYNPKNCMTLQRSVGKEEFAEENDAKWTSLSVPDHQPRPGDKVQTLW